MVGTQIYMAKYTLIYLLDAVSEQFSDSRPVYLHRVDYRPGEYVWPLGNRNTALHCTRIILTDFVLRCAHIDRLKVTSMFEKRGFSKGFSFHREGLLHAGLQGELIPLRYQISMEDH